MSTRMQIEMDADANPKNLTYGSEHAAGMDLYGKESVLVEPHQNVKFDTGVRIALPEGTVGIIRSRSSSFKLGLVIQGTIDEDYRGNIIVSVTNTSSQPVLISRNKSIAQLIVTPYLRVDIQHGKLDNTARGSGGFGSTGNNI